MPESEKRKSNTNGKNTINLVTGGTSSLGTHLIKELLKRGETVRAIVQEHPSQSEQWHILPPGVVLYVVDLTFPNDKDRSTLKEACEGVDRIFHIAGASFNYKFKYDQMININVIGTENLLRAYTDANPESSSRVHFIYSSSCTVYGYKRQGEILTENSEPKPASPYSESKLMAEKVIQAFSSSNPKILYTILRFGVFYGQGYDTEIIKVFKLIKEGKISYIGNGMNHLTLIDVHDAVDAMLLAADDIRSINNIYNITDGQPYTQKLLFEAAASYLKAPVPKRGINPLLARIGAATRNINFDEFEFLASDRKISIDKAKKEIGYNPQSTIMAEGKKLADEYLKRTGA